ncbi:hypothetical protein N7507_009559 [Penicillium longicatenatum]|nr:hypothetical protein N7507_009559 [Penicillium longicatenatum]
MPRQHELVQITGVRSEQAGPAMASEWLQASNTAPRLVEFHTAPRSQAASLKGDQCGNFCKHS